MSIERGLFVDRRAVQVGSSTRVSWRGYDGLFVCKQSAAFRGIEQ